jgi:hypothetical protein
VVALEVEASERHLAVHDGQRNEISGPLPDLVLVEVLEYVLHAFVIRLL